MSELPQEYTGSTKTQHDMLYGEVASGSNFEQMYANGLAKCGDLGFDLPQSLRAGYGEDISDDLINEKAREVISFSAKLAEDMQLSSAFFEKPANTVMLTAIAESWLDNEKRSNETNADKNQLVAEREMLVDIACMLAGKESAGVEDIAHHNPVSKDRYIEAADEQDAMRKEAFLDANVDSDLSNLVTEILNADGQGSFLEDQRELLGISADSQEPFRVKVINIADEHDFYLAAIQETLDYPSADWDYSEHSEEENLQHRQEYLSATEAVDEHNGSNKQEQDAMIGPLLQYEREFGEKFGKLPPAFVNMHADREPELFLRAPQAMALIKYFKEKSPILDSSKADNIDRIMAIIRHEYGHTQKKLLIGPYHQLGMNLEERKAELVSGDKGGYLDVKYMISDLSLATGADIKAMLTSSLREQDTLSSFVSQSARLIGLRNTMLLMALKPLPYENDPEHAKKFADVSKLRADGDESTMDIPIRETVSRTGIEKLEKGVYKWMQRVDDNTGLSDFHELSVPDYRKLHGLGISADVIAEQVRKIREERRDKISV